MQNPRTRLVSLRMTEEEYERLRDASQDRGARSVSEFARQALLTTSQPVSRSPLCCESLVTLDARIAKVEHEVAHIKDELLCQEHPPTTK
jgi:hypothetical protein